MKKIQTNKNHQKRIIMKKMAHIINLIMKFMNQTFQ